MPLLLSHILESVHVLSMKGGADVVIEGISIDSRSVMHGFLYAAIGGTQVDGHEYISSAVENGAMVVLHSENVDEYTEGVTYVRVRDVAEAVGLIAASYYGYPTRSMKVLGVTGTNGKTTVATLLYKLFTQLGYKCGLISTVKNIINEEVYASTHTTPDAVSIQRLFFMMKEAGCEYVFMEVSSHSIHQKRISGIDFNGGVFTNITHDHLDYHKTFEEYIAVKKRFFDDLSREAFAITNIDDKRGAVMLQNTKAEKVTYSLRQMADVKARILENQIYGLLLNIDNQDVHFRLAGTFNAYNIMAVYAAALALEQDKYKVLSVLSNLSGAEGRFEVYRSPEDGIIGIIDYAHTPDALLNVLQTIQKFDGHQNVITVIGCGGDRDTAKRPLMAIVACEHSEKVILTSDNPRSEDPQRIIDDMYNGLSPQHIRKVIQIQDREQAIKTAVMMADREDVVLIAGKGHETYQEIKGVKHPFDDTQKLLEQFKILNK